MRDHIRTALSLIRRGGILRPYFGKARDLITFLGAYQTHFKVLICKDMGWLPSPEHKGGLKEGFSFQCLGGTCVPGMFKEELQGLPQWIVLHQG